MAWSGVRGQTPAVGAGFAMMGQELSGRQHLLQARRPGQTARNIWGRVLWRAASPFASLEVGPLAGDDGDGDPLQASRRRAVGFVEDMCGVCGWFLGVFGAVWGLSSSIGSFLLILLVCIGSLHGDSESGSGVDIDGHVDMSCDIGVDTEGGIGRSHRPPGSNWRSRSTSACLGDAQRPPQTSKDHQIRSVQATNLHSRDMRRT